MLSDNFLTVDLTMFGEGGEAAVSGVGELPKCGALGGGQVAAVEDNANSADGIISKGDIKCTSGAMSKSGKVSEIGGELPKADSAAVENALTERQLRKKQSEFDRLIKGEYKKQYERNVQNIINQRFNHKLSL